MCDYTLYRLPTDYQFTDHALNCDCPECRTDKVRRNLKDMLAEAQQKEIKR